MSRAARRTTSHLAGIVVLCVGALVASMTPAAAAPQLDPDARPVADGVVFNNPWLDSKAIENHIIALIDGAADNSIIRVSTFKYRTETYTEALGRAADRGVTVQVVADSVNVGGEETYFQDLQARLAQAGGYSFAKTCRGSCVKPDENGIDHDKFFLFSNTSGALNVVVQTSANMVSLSGSNSGWGSWNNAVTLVSEPAIYDAYFDRFNAMMAEVPTSYSTAVGTNAKAYFFPRDEGNTIVGILDNVDCSGKNTSGGWGPDHLTSIHVAMYAINDPDIAQKLWALDNAGCVVHYVRTNVTDDDAAIAILNNCSAHNGVTIDTLDDRYGFLHSKYLVIDGYYDGSPNQQLVWTGSYNYTTGALRRNDEALLKIWNHPAIFTAFQTNFQDVVDAARNQNPTPVQSGDGVESPDNGAMVCFEPTGEHLRIYDDKADGHHPVAEYSLSSDPGTVHYAHNYDGAGTWLDVDLTMPEDATVTFRACNYEGDKPLAGGCSGYVTKSAKG